jgi:predicted RNase H-like nuclease (RuvC/YqgF family)
MERDKLIEILENGSEAELTLIQNYLLDQILKKMPTEVEAVRRCVESSEKIKELEEEIMRLKLMVSSLEAELNLARNSTGYYTTTGTGTSWGDNTVTTVGYCQAANSISAADSTSYSTTTATTTWQ